jgi:plastocyanin
VDHPIAVTVNAFTFNPPTSPLMVHPGDTISWTLTQNGAAAPNFTINFSAAAPPLSHLQNFENAIPPITTTGPRRS